VYTRGVDPSDLTLSLSSHRHSYISILFSCDPQGYMCMYVYCVVTFMWVCRMRVGKSEENQEDIELVVVVL
jgi:hypothetical protein